MSGKVFRDSTQRRPRIPKGCDQQGRYPEAAHAATEVGSDCPTISRLTWAVIVAVLIAVLGYAVITANPCDADGRHACGATK